MMEKHLLIAGHPQQNILFAGHIFLEAAIEAGWRAACMDSGEQGEVAFCTLVIRKETAPGRRAAMPDAALLASLDAANVFERTVKPGGLLVLNARAMRRPTLRRDVDVVVIPVSDAAKADPALATLTLLGALAALTGWVSVDDVRVILRKSCTGEAACRAFDEGVAFIDTMLLNSASAAA